ncbi:MAG: FAD-dependent oxidoreductase [Alphaproteobacteria bacterium]|nr:FAD-dependent oxidoreductase [Alphaproteobacteria bacterium]
MPTVKSGGRPSRRAMIKVAAGAASLGSMALPVMAAGHRQIEAEGHHKAGGNHYDVIVIGAGFAGCTASRELAKAGHRVLVLEARNRIGGRAFSADVGGHRLSFGGTWIHWEQPHIWAEVTRYGFDIVTSPGANPDNTALLSDGKLIQAPAGEIWPKLSAAMTKFCDVDGQNGRTVFPRPYEPFFSKAIFEYDGMSLQDRLDQMKFAPLERDLVAAELAINCHNDPKQGGFLDQLKWWSLGDFDFGRLFDKLALYKIAAGPDALARAIIEDGKAEVRLSTPVTSVTTSDRVSTITTEGGLSFTARAVVVAVPLNVVSSIKFSPALSHARLFASTNANTCDGTKCYIKIKQKIGNWLGQGPYPYPISLAWTDSNLDDGTIIVAFGPPHKMDINDDRDVEKALRGLLPGATVEAVYGYQWEDDPFSRGTWCWYRPNILTKYLRDLQQPEWALFFTGSDQANGWMGFMDGAIETGLTTARQVRAYLSA